MQGCEDVEELKPNKLRAQAYSDLKLLGHTDHSIDQHEDAFDDVCTWAPGQVR